MNELKPCPFCGGEAELMHEADLIAYIHCTRCGVHGNSFVKKFDSIADEEAAKAWNRRVSE